MSIIPPIEELWDKVGFKPNEEQKKAILHTKGPLFLTAGPGSGKTRVLLWRTLNLIVFEKINPKFIFLSTFTEKAALQLKEGLQSLLGLVTNLTNIDFDISAMYVGTVHALCNKMLLENRFVGHRSKIIIPMDELEQHFHIANKKIWNTLLKAGELDNLDVEEQNDYINQYLAPRSTPNLSRFDAITKLREFFNRCSEEDIDVEELLEETQDEHLKKMLQMYLKYIETLIESTREKIDFSLIQKKGFEIAKTISKTDAFQHIIIDEYQDTNYIQEKIFFELAKHTHNICVVGDDDQALYRFRGATVENFVEFPKRVKQYIPKAKSFTEIPLDTNYRSRAQIVDIYSKYIDITNWKKKENPQEQYRVHTKKIKPHSKDLQISVLKMQEGNAEESFRSLSYFLKELIDTKKLEDPNQIAFLFSSLKSKQVGRAIEALEEVGLKHYAPRATTFLNTQEASLLIGIFLQIFNLPERDPEFDRGDFQAFHDWMEEVYGLARNEMRNDNRLKDFVDNIKNEIAIKIKDYQGLLSIFKRQDINISEPYSFEKHAVLFQIIENTRDISESTLKFLTGTYLQKQINQLKIDQKPPLSVKDVLARATSLDWNILDIFYKILGFKKFKEMFELVEKGNNIDEASVYNLGLLSQYLSRFLELYKVVIKAEDLISKSFQRAFFIKFLYTIHKRGETEFENSEDPFPRGRIAFLTIHQAKGLEFPVVILGSTLTQDRGIPRMEEIFLDITKKSGEPLERMDEFDTARKFYVALSRAENLLILPNYSRGNSATFSNFIQSQNIPTIQEFDTASLPEAHLANKSSMKAYSYTSDYLLYERCPRQYMIFRKYGFVPSRSQTMFFGSLVHKTIEDIHNFIIQKTKELG